MKKVFVCTVVRAEPLFGARKSRDPERSRRAREAFLGRYVSLPFDDEAATAYAEIRSELSVPARRLGRTISSIAAIARSRDLALVTHNVGEFARVPGLRIEDWEG